MFYEIVRKLPEGAQIVLEAAGDRAVLSIRAGRSRFTLQTLPESDFPDLAAGDFTHRFTLPAGDLKRLIDKTQFAISTEETRYYLNGIYLHTAGAGKGTKLRAVATDGHRLAQFELPAARRRRRHARRDRAAQDGGRGAAADRGQRGRDRGRTVATKIRFTFGDVVLTSKLIDGTFPDYSRVIPLGNDKELEVDKRNSSRRSTASRRFRASAAAPSSWRSRRASWCSRSPIRIPAAPPRNSRSDTMPSPSISASTRATCSTLPPRSKANRGAQACRSRFADADRRTRKPRARFTC